MQRAILKIAEHITNKEIENGTSRFYETYNRTHRDNAQKGMVPT